METFAAKTLLLNLAYEHSLVIYSLTTDRARDMKTLIRCLESKFFSVSFENTFSVSYKKSCLKDILLSFIDSMSGIGSRLVCSINIFGKLFT